MRADSLQPLQRLPGCLLVEVDVVVVEVEREQAGRQAVSPCSAGVLMVVEEEEERRGRGT